MRTCLVCLLSLVLICVLVSTVSAQFDYSIYLHTGTIRTGMMRAVPMAAASTVNRHLLVQFDGPLLDDQKAALADAGFEVQQYVPNYAFIVRSSEPLTTQLMQQFGMRWVDFVQPDYKLAPILRNPNDAPWALRDGDSIQITVVFHRDQSLDAAATEMERTFGARIIGLEPTTNAIDLVVSMARLTEFPQLEQVLFIEPALPQPVEFNNSSRQNINADAAQAAPYNLDGSGVMLAQWDGGRADGSHGDFGGRVIQIDGSSISTHATHVAGTVLGSGAGSSGTYRGMAPGAQLVTKVWFSSASEAFSDYHNVITNYQARASQNSWGYGAGDPATQSSCDAVMGNYWDVSATIDNIVRGSAGEPIIAVWAAGNNRGSSSQYCGSVGWSYNSTDPLANAKNVIAVGAVNSNSSLMTSFSSWGPTDDGRIKPEVVAPGCQTSNDFGVTSCRPGSGYTVMCGTSMAAPAVSGVIALVLQRHRQVFPLDTLLPSTVKGILIGSAVDGGNVGPDYQFGFGRVDALAAVRKVAAGEPSYVEGSSGTGVVAFYDLVVPVGMSKLKATLVWDDPGGMPNAVVTLVNDLDLRLVDPSGTEYLPWALSSQAPALPATRAADHANNVEQVEINNPATGIWRAKVSGFNVPQGPQKYSLVFTPDSVHSSGSYRSLAVTDFPDTAVTPGESTTASFRVTNLGSFDSILVHVTDSSGWIAPVADTILRLEPSESGLIPVSVTIPASSLYGQGDPIFCTITSMTDSLITASTGARISTKRVYGLVVSAPEADSGQSPSTRVIPATVSNLGNSTDNFVVTVSNDSGWAVQPSAFYLPVPAGSDSTVNLSLSIPSEALSGATNRLVVRAVSSGGLAAADTVGIMVFGSLQVPSLVSPEQIVYTKTRTFTFAWQGTADSFSVYVATDSMLVNRVRSYRGVVDTTLVMPAADSLMDGTYYWGVRGFTGPDSSALQRRSRKLYVDNIPPAGVTPQSPVAGYVTSKPFVMTMSLSGSAPKVSPEYMTVQLCGNAAFDSGVVVFDSLIPMEFTTPQVLPEGRWYWRTRRFDLAGNASTWSSSASFLLDTEAPATPVIVAPDDGENLGGTAILLDWTASATSSEVDRAPEYYHVHVSKNPNFTDFTTFNQNVTADSAVVSTSLLLDGRLYYWRVQALDSAGLQSAVSPTRTFVWYNFVCGDLDQSATVDIGDLTAMIQYLFLNGPAPLPSIAGSIDCIPSIDISDLTWMITYLFLNGPIPCCD